MESPIALNPIQEEYLVAALLLEKKTNSVSISALANHFQTHCCFARAAVTGLVKIGLLELSTHHGARLTLEGRMRARDIERRRTAIAEALSETLELDLTTADEAARKLRQALSRSDVNRIICSRLLHRQSRFLDKKLVRCTERSIAVSFPLSVQVLAKQPAAGDADSAEHRVIY